MTILRTPFRAEGGVTPEEKQKMDLNLLNLSAWFGNNDK